MTGTEHALWNECLVVTNAETNEWWDGNKPDFMTGRGRIQSRINDETETNLTSWPERDRCRTDWMMRRKQTWLHDREGTDAEKNEWWDGNKPDFITGRERMQSRMNDETETNLNSWPEEDECRAEWMMRRKQTWLHDRKRTNAGPNEWWDGNKPDFMTGRGWMQNRINDGTETSLTSWPEGDECRTELIMGRKQTWLHELKGTNNSSSRQGTR
jgi:hypothetical protein